MIRILTGLLFSWWRHQVEEPEVEQPRPAGGSGGRTSSKGKVARGGGWRPVPNTDIFKLRIPVSVQVDAHLPETSAVARIKYRVRVEVASEQQIAATESKATAELGSHLDYAGVAALFKAAEEDNAARIKRQEDLLITLGIL